MTFDREALVRVAAEALCEQHGISSVELANVSSFSMAPAINADARAVLAAIAPAVEQRIKEARAEALREAAWELAVYADIPQFKEEALRWLHARAEGIAPYDAEKEGR